MSKALIVTVGGSDEPIVSFIKTHKDTTDFIYFICSGGKVPQASSPAVDDRINGKPQKKCRKCGTIIEESISGKESIIKQSGYKDKYEKVELNNPDDFDEVYKKTYETIEKAKQNYNEIIADFTGGTKTMSSVLTMLAGLDFKIKLSLVKGRRKNTEKTSSDSIPIILNVDLPRSDSILKIADILISKKLYYSACSILKDLLQEGLKQDISEKVRHKYDCCHAFALWDSFEYDSAYNILNNYTKYYGDKFSYLLKILKKNKSSGYEPVFDLVSNAERQADNGYYDNATSRIYRALELFSQTLLIAKFQIDTSHLEKSSDKINMEKWNKYKNEKGEIQIGLKLSYELLNELKDEIGEVYFNKKSEFIDNIKIRNDSKLAHGNSPISETDWKKIILFCKEYLKSCCQKIGINPEYPRLPDKIL